MTRFWDLTKEQEADALARGIDWDLGACLDYNPQPFDLLDIEKVAAVWTGERDDEDWRWVLSLKDGRFVFLQGGCDYTGWDCQSWATSVFTDTAEDAANKALGDVPITEENSPRNAGLGHMLNMLSGSYGEKFQAVHADLLRQLAEGKTETWREKTDRELGNLGSPLTPRPEGAGEGED